MKAGRKYINLFAVVILIIATLFALYSGVVVSYAATTTYSNVLDDLRKDSNFNVADYPPVNNDYSLQVIQLAEGVDDEVFIYVYQPAAQTKLLTATCVNMALSESVDGTKLYDLKLINTTSVFAKYKISGVVVTAISTRYYNITSIYRTWVKGIDKATGNDTTISEVAFKVGQLWTATDKDGEVTYTNTEKNSIEITDKYPGSKRYPNGYLSFGSIDSHFIAFNTDIRIDELYEADVYYESRDVYEYADALGRPLYKYTDCPPDYVYLTDEDYVDEKAKGFFYGEDLNYYRIERASDFIANENITGSVLKEINNKQWVLRYLETDYTVGVFKKWYTEVTEVSILRLKFKTQGIVYNLGVIDNKQSEDKTPVNSQKNWFDILCKWLESITGVPAIAWKIIIIAIPILIVLAVFSAIFPPVLKVVLFIIKGLWYIISAPFQLIAWIVKKLTKDGGADDA